MRESYLLYHEELESLVKNYPTIRRARFWMTFGQEYLTHLRVMQNIGITRIDPVLYNGVEIVPIQFLKAILPNPGELVRTTRVRRPSAAVSAVSRTARRGPTTCGTTVATRLLIRKPVLRV